jgi:nitrate reductase beta subunit
LLGKFKYDAVNNNTAADFDNHPNAELSADVTGVSLESELGSFKEVEGVKSKKDIMKKSRKKLEQVSNLLDGRITERFMSFVPFIVNTVERKSTVMSEAAINESCVGNFIA